MIVKILGILDIFAAMFFWLFAFFNFIPESFVLLAAIYLLAKGVGFVLAFQDIASIIDIIAGIIILLSLSFTMPAIIVVITTLFLIQKGIFSMF